MRHILGFCEIAIFTALVSLLAMTGKPAHAQSQQLILKKSPASTPAAQKVPPPAKATSAAKPSTPSPYTVAAPCPAGKILVDVLPNYLPGGWNSTAMGLVLASADANSQFQGKQTLRCRYNSDFPGGGYISTLSRAVSLDSCVIAPDNRSFRCKPGTIN